jgi:hypothetical protein
MNRKESLNDYTNEELYSICSEVLLRMIEGTWELKRCKPIEVLDKMTMEWISVEERLPPQDGSPFLCFDPNQRKNFVNACIYVVHYEEETEYQEAGYIEVGGECYFRWSPTHWMELPQPPTDNK